jgi:hypothetical protein
VDWEVPTRTELCKTSGFWAVINSSATSRHGTPSGPSPPSFGFFETEDFRITTEDLKVGGGTGLILQIRRDLVFGFTTGIGPDGLAAAFHTRWPF